MSVVVTSNISQLEEQLTPQIGGNTIGFVPTMGALHEGHLSLVREAQKENAIVVVSIFVNPTQFNDPKDLERYPRTLEKDVNLLDTLGGEIIVFAPAVEDIYPEGTEAEPMDVGAVAKVMEGKHRPGHFEGVMQVVRRLFEIVKPGRAYFGEKDFQQLAVIQEMVKRYHLGVEIVRCPIYREPDGLAMSSRNTLLSPEERAIAPKIYQALEKSQSLSREKSVAEIIQWVTQEIEQEEALKVEYFEIVDRDTLEAISSWDEVEHVQGCITVFDGIIRLIDNIPYR